MSYTIPYIQGDKPTTPAELKACPLCDGEARKSFRALGAFMCEVFCTRCHLSLARSTEAEAIAAWNKRSNQRAGAGDYTRLESAVRLVLRDGDVNSLDRARLEGALKPPTQERGDGEAG